MILEVAAYAKTGKGAPPPMLQAAWKAKAWGMPEAGGTRDQRAGELTRMSTALNVYNTVRSFWETADRVQWIERNPEAFKVMQEVRELQREIGG